MLALNPWEGDDSYDFKNTLWYRQASEQPGKVIFTDAYADAITGKPVITIAGRCAGGEVLAFDIFPENFRFSDVVMDDEQSGSFFLCDKQGTLLYAQPGKHHSTENLKAHVKDLFERIKKNELKGYATSVVDMEGQRRGVYYYEMPNGWISIFTVPFSVILKDLNLFSWLFSSLVLLLLAGMALLTLRNMSSQCRIERTNEAVQVLGNSYYAVYRIDYVQEQYEIIKESSLIRHDLAPSGPYSDLLRAVCGELESEYIGEYLNKFSLSHIRSLVEHSIRDFGGDFRQRFGDEFRWVSIHVLFDSSLNSREVILCFREIEREKQQQLEERTLLVNSLNKAMQSDKAKQMFFSNMSHEMRTPLNAIINLTGVAKNAVQEPQKVTGYLNKIEKSSIHLIKLVNDILDLSRLSQGKAELDNEKMNLREFLDECISSFKIQADMEGKTFQVNWNVSCTLVMGDAFRLTQIMNNLLSNALKFTDGGDRILVDISQVSQQVNGNGYIQYKIVVSDTGIGMSEEFLKKIFEPYARESRVSFRHVGGTGLGMPIMKSTVELLNGSVVVNSRENEGTTFTVILPFLAVQQENPAPQDRKQHVSDFLEGKRLLLVEDNEINMEVAEEMLSLKGIVVEKAWSGREALEAFRRSEPFYFDAVLMDMQMPEMGGCEACSRIRTLSRPDAFAVPVIAVTANAFAEDIAETARAGMSDHVSKPIDFEKLFALLEKYIRQYRCSRGVMCEDTGSTHQDSSCAPSLS